MAGKRLSGDQAMAYGVLDNGGAGASGFQPHPGVGRDALAREAPALSIETIAQACGVRRVRAVGPGDLVEKLEDTFVEMLRRRELALVVVRTRPAAEM